jgi:thiamine biosynthesis lipoprotein
MSFHEPTSDVSRLNRAACFETVTVDPATFAVLTDAQALAEESDGVFDITVASNLVAWGFLPRPDGAGDPDPQPSWADIELTAPCQVRFHGPLCIDLGGIAKGYAVDCAVAAMNLPAHAQVSVNAGGDLRIAGPAPERVRLRGTADSEHVPVLEIENASLASSSGRDGPRAIDGQTVGPHVNGKTRGAAGTQSFVSVVARDCMTADALTKIVLAQGPNSAELLVRHNATAYFHDGGDWQTFGAMN